jgi:3-oxoacid CoA-transferase subunit A
MTEKSATSNPPQTASLLCNLIAFLDAFKAVAHGPVGLIDAPSENRLIEPNMRVVPRPPSTRVSIGFQIMNKVYPDAKSALAGLLKDGMMIMSGGFGLCGIAEALSDAIRESGVKNLTVISNNAGVDGIGLSRLLETRQIKKMIASYVGENKLFAQQYLSGELELEFNPQGTLAERIRAGGAGIPAFFTKTGVGTLIAEGKEVREFDGERYVMERGLFADLAIVHAWKGDREGNLIYRKTARNFNPMMATAAPVTVAEVEHLVEAGELDPDCIHTPGVYIKRMIHVPNAEKRIEQRTTRKRAPEPAAAAAGGGAI